MIRMALDAHRPSFSIVVPILNKEGNIESLVQSIFRQTYGPIEVMFVDDGSKDRTTELVKQFEERLNSGHFRISLVKGEVKADLEVWDSLET